MAAYRALTRDRRSRDDGVSRYRVGDRWIDERRSAGDDHHVIGACLDVTRRQQEEAALAWDASHDPLTGLLVRRSFDRYLQRAIATPRDSTAAVSLLMLDIDRFKTVNDRLGHEIGDRVLGAVAHRLSTVVRRSDPLARWGGDEFAIVLESDAQGRRAKGVAQRLLGATREPIQLDPGPFPVHASVGGAVRRAGEDPRELARRADRALYAAKAAGGDRWCLDGREPSPDLD
ncbi:MAG: diguanylate cyclase domain-containing protein [Candidatus Dormibacteraceae bacterium]